MKGAESVISRAATLEALSREAADLCATCAAEAIAAHGLFSIALAGGSTPRMAYRLLASPPWLDRIDWAQWRVFWGDERMTAPDDPNSNFRLAHDALLSKVPIPADHIYRIPTEAGSARDVAAAYEKTLRESFLVQPGDLPRLDLVLLGLGSDGHVASLFPGMTAIEEVDSLVTSSPPGTLPPPVDRVTLTLPVINAARAVAILVAGAEKASAVERVLCEHEQLPATRVNPRDGELRWLLDTAATPDCVRA